MTWGRHVLPSASGVFYYFGVGVIILIPHMGIYTLPENRLYPSTGIKTGAR